MMHHARPRTRVPASAELLEDRADWNGIRFCATDDLRLTARHAVQAEKGIMRQDPERLGGYAGKPSGHLGRL
jgi:hypothetical protein